KNSEIVLEMLRRLNKDLGQTIVMITHNPEATTYFDRVVHMRDGIIVDGIPADLHGRPRTKPPSHFVLVLRARYLAIRRRRHPHPSLCPPHSPSLVPRSAPGGPPRELLSGRTPLQVRGNRNLQ